MSFSQKTVLHVAHLARISVEENNEESKALVADLSHIISLVDQISEVSTESVKPMAHPLPHTKAHLREDTVTEQNLREVSLALAPKAHAGLYLVPAVIDN